MLYIFFGDRFGSREKARNFVEACRKKLPNGEYIKIDSSDTELSPEELLYGSGLFESKYIVFLNELSNSDLFKHVEDNIKEYQASPHAFIVFEPEIDSKLVKKFEKAGAKLYEVKEKNIAKTSTNSFVLADYFSAKDKSKAFKTLHKLISEGEEIEILFGILAWQIRALMLAKNSKSAIESGLKTFVYTKAKKASKNFSNEELFQILLNLDKYLRLSRIHRNEDPIENFILSSI